MVEDIDLLRILTLDNLSFPSRGARDTGSISNDVALDPCNADRDKSNFPIHNSKPSDFTLDNGCFTVPDCCFFNVEVGEEEFTSGAVESEEAKDTSRSKLVDPYNFICIFCSFIEEGTSNTSLNIHHCLDVEASRWGMDLDCLEKFTPERSTDA
jgi:hypothetical protein